MNSAAFVAAYPFNAPRATMEGQPLPELMRDSRALAQRFGQVLHTYLLHPGKPVSEIPGVVTDYVDWLNTGFIPLLSKLNATDSPEGNHALNELNFHSLNMCMGLMWLPMHEGNWTLNPKERCVAISHTQDILAIRGLNAYWQREQISGIKQDYAYFSDKNNERRATFEGVLNEFDAAIVLLEVIKRRPDLTVLPAPLQFEKSRHKTAVDFVVVSIAGQAIGVQMKSLLLSGTKDTYDSDRVVCLDAKIDFGNVLARRTTPGKSHVKQVGWAGIICAQRVKQINTIGEHQHLLKLEKLDVKTVNRNKFVACQLLKNIRPNMPEIVGRVSDRILSKV